MSLLTAFQKQRVESHRQVFEIDHFGKVWDSASEAHKRLLLRAAFLDTQSETKFWKAYSEEERRTLHTFGLWLEEFADFQKAVKKRSKAFEQNINKAD